ncbi:MAG: TldD/PmbA family protein [Candidatus Methanomethylophilaceae archaeon]
MEDRMERMMDEALRLGAEHVELRHQEDLSRSYLLKNGCPEMSASEASSGISFRVLVDGALGFGASNHPDESVIRDVLQRCVRNTRSSARMRDRPIRLAEEDACRASYQVSQRRPFQDRESDIQDYLRSVDSAALEGVRSQGADLPGRFLQLEVLQTSKLFINSEGSRVESVIPRCMMHMILTAVGPQGSAQRSLSRGGSGGWEVVDSWDLLRAAKDEGAMLAKVLTHAQPLRGDVYDVILGPEVVGLVAHESSGHPAEADRILGREAAQAGETYLDQDSRGLRVGSELVNVVDDPTLPNSFGYYLYDDEGVKARPRDLIRGGVIEEFLHNRETGAEMGCGSNGSSRSLSFNREPIVRMANTFVAPGDHSLAEMLEGIKNGVLIKNFMEWNIDDRRYNQRYVGLEAHLVKDGELVGLVRNPALEISTPALWSAVDAVGKDLSFDSAFCGKGDPMQGIPVWTGGPHLRLRDVRLGGSA